MENETREIADTEIAWDASRFSMLRPVDTQRFFYWIRAYFWFSVIATAFAIVTPPCLLTADS
jgi:hypothetical protein